MTSRDESVSYLSLIIRPSKEIRKKALRVSREVKETFPVNFFLDDEQCLTYIALHYLALPDSNIPSLKDFIKSITAKYQPITLTMNYALTYCQPNWLIWKVKNNVIFNACHRGLVTSLNPLRRYHRLPYAFDASLLNEDQRRNLISWDNPIAMDTFFPFIRISQLTNEEDLYKAHSLFGQLGEISFKFDQIDIAKFNPNSQIVLTDIQDSISI